MELSKSSKEPVVLAPVDVDPRSYFSNERTCIEWLHSAGILGAFAAGLVNTGQLTPRIAGIFLLIPAVVVLIHAARMQQKRTRQLDERAVDSHFDRIGPSMLTFLLSLSLLYNLIMSISRYMFTELIYKPSNEFSTPATSTGTSPAFWICSALLAVGAAAGITLPAHMGASRGQVAVTTALGQPFLESEARAVNFGPLRPKLLYANERTFIHWSHVCSLVSSTAVTITSNPIAMQNASPLTTLIAGGSLTCIALALLSYAHATYFWRANAIVNRGDKRVDDPVGPPLLAGALLIALAGGFIALIAPYANPPPA